ncbi:MAG: 16S rRNA (guanine(527)-N(7))-methyltransferase RsmG [Phycisphaerae bacterium]|nr:16S rRNA (guanine(527)-N(7))-methyltransferase RsmG [Phycisphaerae bacterium]
MVFPHDDVGPECTEFTNTLHAACRELGISLEQNQTARLWQHFTLMLSANRHINLTRITAPAQAAVKHYADSLALLTWAEQASPSTPSVLDVGTGAGFPAVPLAVCRPAWSILAIDSTRKKTDFLAAAAATLDLQRLAVRHVRARELAGQTDPFDLVLCRAVGGVIDCLRETRRLLPPGGNLVLYATPRAAHDLTPAKQRQIERLGFDPAHRHPYRLIAPGEEIERELLIWRRH